MTNPSAESQTPHKIFGIMAINIGTGIGISKARDKYVRENSGRKGTLLLPSLNVSKTIILIRGLVFLLIDLRRLSSSLTPFWCGARKAKELRLNHLQGLHSYEDDSPVPTQFSLLSVNRGVAFVSLKSPSIHQPFQFSSLQNYSNTELFRAVLPRMVLFTCIYFLMSK